MKLAKINGKTKFVLTRNNTGEIMRIIPDCYYDGEDEAMRGPFY